MNIERRMAVRLLAWRTDFKGSIEEWKKSFYVLWEYQVMFDFAYRLQLLSSVKLRECVEIVFKKGFKDVLIETMEGLGYREIDINDCMIAVADDSKSDELLDVELLVLEH